MNEKLYHYALMAMNYEIIQNKSVVFDVRPHKSQLSNISCDQPNCNPHGITIDLIWIL